jgi:tRNA (guanine37-N1)-methyltransferase
VKYLVVKKGIAEQTRKLLIKSGHLHRERKILRKGDHVLFPLVDGAPETLGVIIESPDSIPVKVPPRWYGDMVNLPEDVKGCLPRSIDIIGGIAIFKLPEELEAYKGEIADAILATNRSIRTVAVDRGVHDEERIRRLEIVRGVSTETEYKEYGLRIRLDPTKVFFTPRLGYERRRVSALVQPHERVLDMFAGVGPFALHICRRVPTSEVYAVDSNPHAIEYMKINAGLNRIKNLYPICGRIEDVIHEIPGVDRIIMNLPMRSIEYLHLALGKLERGWIHIYRLIEGMNEDAASEDTLRRIRSLGREAESITPRRIKSYSPGAEFFVFDVRVTPT